VYNYGRFIDIALDNVQACFDEKLPLPWRERIEVRGITLIPTFPRRGGRGVKQGNVHTISLALVGLFLQKEPM